MYSQRKRQRRGYWSYTETAPQRRLSSSRPTSVEKRSATLDSFARGFAMRCGRVWSNGCALCSVPRVGDRIVPSWIHALHSGIRILPQYLFHPIHIRHKRVDAVGIEMPALLVLKVGEAVLEGPGLLVGPLRDQGVEDVGNGCNAGDDRN